MASKLNLNVSQRAAGYVQAEKRTIQTGSESRHSVSEGTLELFRAAEGSGVE